MPGTDAAPARSRVPSPGVWCPAVIFFDQATDSLDLDSQAKYYSYLATTGLAGLVILGTNAEAFRLTREERATLVATARSAVGASFPLMVECGSHSTKQTIELIEDACKAGADYALVLPAAYFGKATTPATITRFYSELAANSPLPVVISNFPAMCNGVDLDSDMITSLAKKHINIVGVKLTCASVEKITRLSAEPPAAKFSCYGGQSDFLIGRLASGSAGCIAAFANIFPKTIVRIYQLCKSGRLEEAFALHQKAARAESPCKAGIAGTKYAVAQFSAKAAGIEEAEEKLKPRSPYEPPSEMFKKTVKVAMEELNKIELAL